MKHLYVFGFEINDGLEWAVPISLNEPFKIEDKEIITDEVRFRNLSYDVRHLNYVLSENMNTVYSNGVIDDDALIMVFEIFANKDQWIYDEIRKTSPD